jgi:AcrR family transcriptional regulator
MYDVSVNPHGDELMANAPVETSERPPREPLTRDRIIHTALRLMDEEGLEAVTMRRIGRELGVEAMSLYNHVQDKEDILDGIIEEVLADFRVPDEPEFGEAARLGAHEYRRLLLAHPNVVKLMAEREGAFTNPESLRGYEFALDRFRSLGLSRADCVKAFHVFGGYILGFVVMELGLVGGPEQGRKHEEMARLLQTADLPRLREALPYIVNCDLEEQFEFGLDLLIEGLRSRAAQGRMAY